MTTDSKEHVKTTESDDPISCEACSVGVGEVEKVYCAAPKLGRVLCFKCANKILMRKLY